MWFDTKNIKNVSTNTTKHFEFVEIDNCFLQFIIYKI